MHGSSIQTRQVRLQLSHRVRRLEPGTDDLVEAEDAVPWAGSERFARCILSGRHARTEAASRPRASKTARAMPAQVIGSPSLLRL